MVEILKPAPDDWHVDWSCKECKAELRAKKADISVGEFGGGFGESSETKYYVDCPTCGETKIIPTPPALIRQAAEAKKNQR